MIAETLKLIRATFPATIEIKKNIQSNLGAVLADETQIHQVMMNLCANAFQAMQEEGGLLEVTLVPFTVSTGDSSSYLDISPGKYLKLIVADTGQGMDSGTMTRIFEPYFTTKKSSGGTGLGLSTVHGIVKDHGGGIKVTSEPGEGTTFDVFFPIAETAPVCSDIAASPLPIGKERILLVDDEELILEIGREMLKGLGYQVETRASSIDALEAFRTDPTKYDLVISDMTMPRMTGERLAKEIKKFRPDIPIILCTGFSTKISPDKLTVFGVNALLMKPVRLSDLAHTVRKVLDDRGSKEKGDS